MELTETTALLREPINDIPPLRTSRLISRYLTFAISILNLALITALLPAITLLANTIALFPILGATDTLILLYTITTMVCVALLIAIISAVIHPISKT